ncbi:MAG: assimilatory sulfite reductase (NADPH) flavoprotein subunit [Verrucomicrobiota bacterium]
MSQTDPILPQSAPFKPEEVQWLNAFLPALQGDQLIWLEGFISGLRAGKGVEAKPAQPQVAPELTVLYGTESGNAENLADTTAKAAVKAGFKAKIANMADTKPAKLKSAKNLLVIVSTWGEGDPPESAADFYNAVMGDGAPTLEGTNFSVLGLGDTSYEHFCKIGKDFDSRLEKLGATRIHDRKDCDVDYDDDFNAWLKGNLTALESQLQSASTAAVAVSPAVAPAVKYSRKNPFPAPLKERVLLNGEGSAKETIHLEFDLEGSGLQYEVGDALAVVPKNAADVVEDIIRVTSLDKSEKVELKDGSYTLEEALSSQLDITAISLPVVKRYNEIAKNEKLADLISPENKDQFKAYIDGREIIDILEDFPAPELKAQELVGIMRKLPPRLYSIASSPRAHPGEVHLTVGVFRYETNERKRKGVCSTFVAERIEEGETAGVFVTPNKNFRLPADNSAPVIMVGPGTGIAPFRAFVEDRKATNAEGKNWLFFGDQHYLTDFLYQLEWQDYFKEGILTKLDVAFSRDQKEKVYVQDRMRQRSKELFAWLEEGAYFYVCGDASRMAHDVDQALHEIIAQEGEMDEAKATEYVKALKAAKRYQRDVY